MTSQLSVTKPIDEQKIEIKEKKEAELICPICKEIKERYFDICPNKENVNACIDCIKKRHNLTSKGFEIEGDNIKFYSHTTGWERRNKNEFWRLFIGFMGNPVFPYSVNTADPKYQCNCFGITKEFGEWLKENICNIRHPNVPEKYFGEYYSEAGKEQFKKEFNEEFTDYDDEENTDDADDDTIIETNKSNDLIIDKNFVLNTDLEKIQDTLFKEDSEGVRYRERIIEAIEQIGVEAWCKARGLPTNPDSIWKNRYTGDEITVKEYIEKYNYDKSKMEFYLWEHYNAKELWTDKELMNKYKEKKNLFSYFNKEVE